MQDTLFPGISGKLRYQKSCPCRKYFLLKPVNLAVSALTGHIRHIIELRFFAYQELHESIEQPARCRAQSGRLAKNASLSG